MSSSPSNKTPPPTSKFSLLDYIDEGRLADWLSLHGKNIIYGLLIAIASFAIIYQVSHSFSAKPQQEYLQAANDFNYITNINAPQDPVILETALDRLTSIMNKFPELHTAYDGSLAQYYLNNDLVEKAKPYLNATLEKVKADKLPLYSEFSSTSLLIGEKNYKEALNQALSLQEKMRTVLASDIAGDKRSFGDELFAFNLFRIALLQDDLGDKEGELQTWKEWKNYAKLETRTLPTLNVNPQAFRLLIQQLAVGSVSIPDYIAFRENLLLNLKK